MSQRTLIEINHDYLLDILDSPAKMKQLRLALSMGCGDHYPLPSGVTFLGMRHHSDPPFMPYEEQNDMRHAIERLRAGKRVVSKQSSGVNENG
jgi:hypothetical protein